MTIEVPLPELYAMADGLHATAGDAEDAATRVGDGTVEGPVQPALQPFCETVAVAAGFLAGELRWLGSTVAGVADHWAGFDGSVLAPRGQVVPR